MTHSTAAAPVRVVIGERETTWSPEHGFDGDTGLVGRAKFAAYVGLEVPVAGITVVAGTDTPAAAAAALVAFDPDQVRVVAGPPELVARQRDQAPGLLAAGPVN